MFKNAEIDNIDSTVECDICICGGGPAGLSVATSLIKEKSLRICLVESGGFDYDKRIASLYSGSIDGENYFDLDITRVRRYGGSSNHWGGWCRPLDRSVFADRPWLGATGWPISYEDVYSNLDAAQEFLELGPPFYNTSELRHVFDDDGAFNKPPKNFKYAIWNESEPSINLGITTRKHLESTENIIVFLYANLTDFTLDEQRRSVKSIKVQTLSKKNLK